MGLSPKTSPALKQQRCRPLPSLGTDREAARGEGGPGFGWTQQAGVKGIEWLSRNKSLLIRCSPMLQTRRGIPSSPCLEVARLAVRNGPVSFPGLVAKAGWQPPREGTGREGDAGTPGPEAGPSRAVPTDPGDVLALTPPKPYSYSVGPGWTRVRASPRGAAEEAAGFTLQIVGYVLTDLTFDALVLPSCERAAGDDDAVLFVSLAVKTGGMTTLTSRRHGQARSGRGIALSPSSPSACFPQSLHEALVFITFSLVFEKGMARTFRSVPF